jgi:hypothetical protein
MLGKSHFKRLHAPHNHFVNNCEVMKRSTYDIKEATEVMSNMSSLNKGNNKITELRTILQRENQNSLGSIVIGVVVRPVVTSSI